MGGTTIWLVGMMGAGKTAVGRALAERLGVPFHDSDAEVEAEAGQSIPEIFAAEGEPAFRQRERAVIEKWTGQPGVIALGGGAMAQPGMAAHLSENGTAVYLRARVTTLLERIGDAASRPLLAGLDGPGRAARLADLLAEREQVYAASDVIVDADAGSPVEVAERVARALEGGEGA